LYNEAAGLALLHERLGELAKKLRQAVPPRMRGGLCRRRQCRRNAHDRRGLAADALDVQVVSLSRNFGKEAALMAGLDHARRGGRPVQDGDGQHPPDLSKSLSAIGSMAVTTSSIPQGASPTNDRFCVGCRAWLPTP